MKTLPAMLTLIILRFGSCDQSTGPSKATFPIASLGDTVRIKIYESVQIESTAFTLSFVDVAYDSRCPSDVVCPWSGQAWADFSVIAPSMDTVMLRFVISGAIYTAQDIVSDTLGLRISMRYLDPYPRMADSLTWRKSNYNALLHISRSIAPG